MRKISVLIAVLVLIGISCKKENKDPQYSGEIVLSSEILLQSGQKNFFYGFSFETGEISTYSLTDAPPDLAAIHVILGEDMTVDLSSSDDQDAFHKNSNFSTSTEAEVYFTNYGEVLATDFQPIAQSIKENQVWTVQTVKNNFAKIWIKEITVKTGSTSDFADIRMQYQYQPDGSRTFDCNCN